MGVFAILLLLPIIIQHLTVKIDRVNLQRKKQVALTIFFVLLVGLLSFRHETVGIDTENYIMFFERVSLMKWGEVGNYSVEWGFSYFGKLVSAFFKNPQFFIGLSALITVRLLYPTYIRLCVDPSLTIVLFCTSATFVVLFSGIRQMLAVGIGFVAYEFVREKRMFSFFVTVAIAMSFHTSAFILIFMYPLYHARVTKKMLRVVVPVVALIFIFNKQIFSVLSFFVERYTKYDATMTETGAYTMLILFVLFSIFSFVIPDESLLDDETIGLRNFLLFSLIVQLFAPLHTLAMRMNYYYLIFIPLLLPKIISCRNEKWQEIAVASRYIMVVFFAVYFFLGATSGNNLNVFPYHFFWEFV